MPDTSSRHVDATWIKLPRFARDLLAASLADCIDCAGSCVPVAPMRHREP